MLGRVSGTLPGATTDIGGRARGVIPAAPGPPLSILDASKQLTDKLDSYQTGNVFSITPSGTANCNIRTVRLFWLKAQ